MNFKVGDVARIIKAADAMAKYDGAHCTIVAPLMWRIEDGRRLQMYTVRLSDGSLAYATSGHLGNFDPDFGRKVNWEDCAWVPDMTRAFNAMSARLLDLRAKSIAMRRA